MDKINLQRVFFALGLACLLIPAPGRADTRNALANDLAPLQVADCVTTVALGKAPDTFERDPLARPVANSLPLCLVAAGGVNLLLRNPHRPLWLLRMGVLIESALVVNNEGVAIRTRIGR